jgi:hypothetical protein
MVWARRSAAEREGRPQLLRGLADGADAEVWELHRVRHDESAKPDLHSAARSTTTSEARNGHER